jgi:hypothetical protein
VSVSVSERCEEEEEGSTGASRGARGGVEWRRDAGSIALESCEQKGLWDE